jgi:HK97 family phage portal protein
VSILRQLARPHHRDLETGPGSIPSNSNFLGSSGAGVVIGEGSALQQLTVWSCISLISDSLSQLPAGAFRKVDGFPRRIEDPQLLVKPHAEMEWPEWIGRLAVSLLLRGNGYGKVISRDSRGFPTQILPLHPDQIAPRRNLNTGVLEYRVGSDTLTPFEVMHIRGMTLPGNWSVTGLSPIQYARQTIGLALGAEEFAARFFGDGAHPSGVLAAEGKITEEDATTYQERWLKAHGDRQRKPAVLGGGLKWTQISITPEESQFLETLGAKRSEIAGFFRVPPHMIGEVDKSTSWGKGIEEQMLGYITFTLGIWIIRFEAAITALLPRPQYMKLNVAGLLRGRLLERFQSYLLGRQGGWLNVDDIRAYEELPPLPDGKGQDYLMPLNYAPVAPGGGPLVLPPPPDLPVEGETP